MPNSQLSWDNHTNIHKYIRSVLRKHPRDIMKLQFMLAVARQISEVVFWRASEEKNVQTTKISVNKEQPLNITVALFRASFNLSRLHLFSFESTLKLEHAVIVLLALCCDHNKSTNYLNLFVQAHMCLVLYRYINYCALTRSL